MILKQTIILLKKLDTWNINGEIFMIFSGGSYKIKIIFLLKMLSTTQIIKFIKKVDEKIQKKCNKQYQKKFKKKLKKNNFKYSPMDNSNISNSDFDLKEGVDFILGGLKKNPIYI